MGSCTSHLLSDGLEEGDLRKQLRLVLLHLFNLLFLIFNQSLDRGNLALKGSVFKTFLNELSDENLLLLAQLFLLFFEPSVFVQHLIPKLDNSTVHAIELKDLTLDCPRLFLELGELLEMLVAFLLDLLDGCFFCFLLLVKFFDIFENQIILVHDILDVSFHLGHTTLHNIVQVMQREEFFLLVGRILLKLSELCFQLVLLLDLCAFLHL